VYSTKSSSLITLFVHNTPGSNFEAKMVINFGILEGILRRLNLRKVDLSQLENYNHRSLVTDLLHLTVFNEFSNCRKLVLQNLDTGRAEACVNALTRFLTSLTLSK
jgi:hypothetical protein